MACMYSRTSYPQGPSLLLTGLFHPYDGPKSLSKQPRFMYDWASSSQILCRAQLLEIFVRPNQVATITAPNCLKPLLQQFAHESAKALAPAGLHTSPASTVYPMHIGMQVQGEMRNLRILFDAAYN